MNTNANTTTLDMNNAAAVEAEATRLQAQADEMQNRLHALRGENDRAASAPTGAVGKVVGTGFARTAKRALSWTLGVGVVGLVGAYAYSRLRSAGVDVPTGEEIGASVANVVDAATA